MLGGSSFAKRLGAADDVLSWATVAGFTARADAWPGSRECPEWPAKNVYDVRNASCPEVEALNYCVYKHVFSPHWDWKIFSEVELLQGLCQPGASAPSDQVFNSMLDATVRTRSYGEAWDVLELLLKSGRKADKYFVSILTKSLESSNDKRWVRRGINLVDKFIEQQQEDVDEIVFNSLLNVLGQTGDMLKLQQTLNKMNEYGVAPSAVTFGTVVKAYGRARDTESVIKVWNQMRSRCLGINPVTCGCVLDACVKCNSLDKAMAIFQEMRMQGMHKNTVLYATLIKGLAKIRDLQGAMNLYHEMRIEGVPCNLVTFNSLMDVCVRCGDLQTAAYFLQDMMQMGIEPDLITFSTLIKGYSHIGEVHKALALSKELKARGLKCDEIMYNSLIDGCAKARKLHEGLAVFEDEIWVEFAWICVSCLVATGALL